METRLLRPTGSELEHDPAVLEAARIVRAGGLVAFPTETVYGLGADATSAPAVEAVYAAKGRPPDNPCIVHLADAADLARVAAFVPRAAQELARRFWPGALTLVLPAAPSIRRTVTRGLDTVAVRVPDHPIARALLRACRRPLVAPSANRSGRPSPTKAGHVLADLGGRIDAVLDGGPCRVGIESTVLDLTHEPPALLRPGAVDAPSLERVLGTGIVTGRRTALARSPGTRYRHYAPDASVVVLRDGVATTAAASTLEELAEEFAVAWIASERVPEHLPVQARLLDRRAPGALARSLYDDLRQLDLDGCDLVFVEAPAHDPAVIDRLERAATLLLGAGDVAHRGDLLARLRASAGRR